MSADTEPPVKKIKMVNDMISHTIDTYINCVKNAKNLQAVLSDDFHKPLPLVKVYVGHVKNPKDLSRVILILNNKVPLKELQHLKRVRKREVILCPTHFLNRMFSIQEYLECNVQELKDVFEYFKEVDVPLIPPKLKKQYNSQVWSCNFHPNKYYEKLVSDSFFSESELETHVAYMEMAFEVARWHLQREPNSDVSADFLLNVNTTVIVDPLSNSVVAVSFYNDHHPIRHSAMLAIDNVAKTQYGGVWGTVQENKTDCTLYGIDSEVLQYLQQKFPNSKFGARTYRSKRGAGETNENLDSESSNDKSESSDGPYLCTGYYVYMLREPCLMCGMALVHARARRVFFCFNNLNFGALNSRTKLQAVSSLNHHFEVFTGFL